MSEFTDRIDSRRRELGLTIADVTSALQLQGVEVAYPTVAAWFNGGRGDRWRPEELFALLELLQTDLAVVIGNGLAATPDLSGPIYNAISRELASLTAQQQAALLSLVKSFQG